MESAGLSGAGMANVVKCDVQPNGIVVATFELTNTGEALESFKVLGELITVAGVRLADIVGGSQSLQPGQGARLAGYGDAGANAPKSFKCRVVAVELLY